MAEPGPPPVPSDALMDLLIKDVTAGLSSAEARTLKDQDDAVTRAYLRDFEQAAAWVDLEYSDQEKVPLPANLRTRIDDLAQTIRNENSDQPGRRQGDSPSTANRARRSSPVAWLAAAACLLLALFGWLRPLKPARPPVIVTMPATPPVAVPPVRIAPPAMTIPPPTPSEERAALLAQPGTVRLTLASTKDPAAQGVSADVIWDPATQQGFLHIAGLKPNDAAQQQYQAWIFDAARDKRYPLTAGLFNVPADATEVVVPLHTELPVQQAKAFAVTLEQPGGVVVPALRHVIALGTVG